MREERPDCFEIDVAGNPSPLHKAIGHEHHFVARTQGDSAFDELRVRGESAGVAGDGVGGAFVGPNLVDGEVTGVAEDQRLRGAVQVGGREGDDELRGLGELPENEMVELRQESTRRKDLVLNASQLLP